MILPDNIVLNLYRLASGLPPSQISTADKQYLITKEYYYGDNRHYHDDIHILTGFSNLLRNTTYPYISKHLIMAWFYHDVIYVAGSATNEVDSAEFAMKHLEAMNWSPQDIAEVYRLILLTKHLHQPGPDDIQGQLMVDTDLEGLMEEYEVMQQNTAAIRKEFAHVPEKQWLIGRIAFWKTFLDNHKTIFNYQTNKLFDEAARMNIGREIAELEEQLRMIESFVF